MLSNEALNNQLSDKVSFFSKFGGKGCLKPKIYLVLCIVVEESLEKDYLVPVCL